MTSNGGGPGRKGNFVACVTMKGGSVLENCDLCHFARAGVKSGIRRGPGTLGPGEW